MTATSLARLLVAAVAALLLFAGTAQSQTTAEPSSEPPSEATVGSAAPATVAGFGIAFESASDVSIPFFTHEPFGFNTQTPAAFVTGTMAGFERIRATIIGLFAAPTSARSSGLALSIAMVIATIALIVFDFRLRRAVPRWVDRASELLAGRPTWLIELVRALIRIVAGVLIPTGALAALLVPTDPSAWMRASTNILAYIIGYRALSAVTRELLDGHFLPVDIEAAARLQRAALRSYTFVLVVGVVMHTIAVLDYSADVQALARTVFRGSVTLLSITFLRLQPPLLAMLPSEGSAGYLRFRAAFAVVLRWVLIASTVLLGIWTAGFERAASTMLVRSWALVGLLVAGVLLKRWLDQKVRRLDATDISLQTSLLRLGDGFARTVSYIAFAILVLDVLGLRRPLTSFLDSLRVVVGETPISLLDLLGAVTTIALTVLATRVVRILLEKLVYPFFEFDEGGVYAANTALTYFVVVVSIGIALIQLGINFSALAVFAGALGVGIGIGLQDFARNLISGFILLFGRSIEKGDLVSVQDQPPGYVQSITARAVKLKTRDNFEVMIPTAIILSQPLVNWTHSDAYVRLHIPVSASYHCDPAKVREALLEAADRFDANARTHPADVWLSRFGDNGIEYELLLWIDARQITPEAAQGKALFIVWQVLHERGIEIPFPQRDVHIKGVEVGASVRALFGGQPLPAPVPEAETAQQQETSEPKGPTSAEAGDTEANDDSARP